LSVNISSSELSLQLRKQQILDILNEQQKDIVLHYNGLIMASAGPGAGKTKVLVSRTAYMIASGIRPENILLFTFTKKAATEIKERVMKMVGDLGALVTISTYHSFCAKFIRKYHDVVGLQKNFSIVDDSDKTKIIKKILKDLNYDLDVDFCLYRITKYKEQYKSPANVLQELNTIEDNIETRAAAVYDAYQRTLIENNTADFDDLICYAIKILESRPDIQNAVWNRYKYISSDEAQDSSEVDLRLIFNLIPPQNYNLLFCGDFNQSIYAFRGARPELLYKKLKSFPDLQTFYLEKNYRSTQNIVNSAQSLIEKNHRLDDKTIYTNNETGSKVYVLNPRSSINEAESIASFILHFKNDDQIKKYGEIAILYRNLFLGKEIEDALMKNKIPYKVISGTSFYERIEVKDIIAYLDFLVNPQNLLSLRRIIDIPKVGIGDVTFAKIKKELMTRFASYGIIDIEGMVQILGEMAKDKKFKKLARFHQSLECIVSHMHDEPHALIDTILKAINYYEYLATLKGKKGQDQEEMEDEISERVQNIELLKDLAYEYADIRDFLDSVTLNTEMPNEDLEDDECVKLMTIHASKGLEFPIVFVIGCNNEILPSRRAITAEDKEEERRLLYVAMTRAKELLMISAPRTRMQYGQLKPQMPSPFISEIDDQYVEYVS
jgi:DNA helicase-2/ATP-dependent DNA helicase PcrA